MREKLGDKRLQVIIFVALAAVIAYNMFYFAGRGPRSRPGIYQEAGLETGVAAKTVPNWAAEDYGIPSAWGRNPFTGRDLDAVRPPALEPDSSGTPER
jgi:hypothetical protein